MNYKSITDKQAAFLMAKDKRLNFLTGSVRSGKTYVSLIKFVASVAQSLPEYEFLLSGKTITSLKRNCFGYLKDLCGDYFAYSLSAKEGWLFGRRIFIEGANDERSEHKIRGMTLGGSYCDEITLYPQSFVNMLLSRLSLPGAKLYATANPDRPTHYIKRDFIDNPDIDIADWRFTLDDNTFLDTEYVAQLKQEYTGVYYERYILGRWVLAEGRVYPNFNKDIHTVPTVDRDYTRFYISNDYGTQHPCVFLLWGLCNGVWYCIKEYYHKGKDGKQKSVDEYYSDLLKFADGYRITKFICDKAPIAASFNIHLKRRKDFMSQDCDNEVLAGIQDVATALNKGLIKINDCCKNAIEEFDLYSWEQDCIEDRPIKEDDDALDALRYFVKTLGFANPRQQSITISNTLRF